jgi:tetratricopeptide (TPR) repeat protein
MSSHLRFVAVFFLVVTATFEWGCTKTPQQREARYLEAGKRFMQSKDYNRAILEFRNATIVMPKDSEAFYQLGVACLMRRDLRSAAIALKKSTELDPKNTAAQVKYAELLTMAGDEEMAKQSRQRMEDILNASPGNPDALTALGLSDLRFGDQRSGEEHLRMALKNLPEKLQASLILARLKLETGDLDGAGQVLLEAVKNNPNSSEAALGLAAYYKLRKKWPEAEAGYRGALKIDPKEPRALNGIATVQIQSGQKDKAEQTYRELADLPNNPYRHYHAAFLFQEGRRDEAIAEFVKLAKQDPADRDARTRLVTAYLLAGKGPEAEKVLGAALKSNPKDVDALLQRARISLAAGKPFDAQRDVEQVLRFQPTSPLAHYLLAQVYRAASHNEQYAVELGEVLRIQPDLLGVRIELAQAQLAAKQSKAALALLDGAPPYQKQTLPYVVQRNWALLADGNLAEAGKGIAQALKAERRADVLLQGGMLELQRRNYAVARTYLTESLDRNPEDLRALESLARSYADQGQVPAAFQKLREHAARRPKSAAVQEYLGEQLQLQGNFAEARSAFNAAKAADPGYTRADLSLAQIDLHDNRLDEARKRASSAAAGPDAAPAGLILGEIETRAGNYDAAVAHYRKVLAVAPRNVRALNNIAYLLVERQGRIDEALKYAQLATEIVPDDAGVQDTMGWVLYRKGIYNMAIEYLKRAAGSNMVVARYHLGVAYLKAGQVGTGRQVLDAALKTDPTLPEAQLAKKALAEIAVGKN